MTHTDRYSGRKSPFRGDFAQNSHTRTIFLIATAISLCSLLFCAAAAADQGPFPDTGVLESAAYTLTGDVTLSANLSIPANVTCTIDLNGYVLKGTGSGSVITVESGGNLTLTDSCPGTKHYFSKDEITGQYTYAGEEQTGSLIELSGGCLTGGKAVNGGGILLENGGKFTMDGGAVVGNAAVSKGDKGGYGGGVSVGDDSLFTLNGVT